MKRIGLAVCAGLALASPAAAAPAPRPKLVVAISIDQFSAALFEQWRGRFTGGLARLSQGIVYPSGYQSHGVTETCPGHASLLTGKYPSKTGIVGNTMRDEASGREIYCLLDTTVTLAHSDKANPVGPQRLMATTVGDWLKQASPASKVVSVSGKDRGAITMAGHDPDGVFWLMPGYGFTTYLRPGQNAAAALAPVAAVNAAQAGVWTHKASWTYADADCRGLDSQWSIAGKPWTSQLPPTGYGASDKTADINRDVMGSPTPDEMTGEAASRLVRYFKLGQGPAVDLLAVSFSATDFVGHRYGTQGPEMCEQMHRLDRSIGALLKTLDAQGVSYVVALSADHGGSDFTERLQARGYPQAQRADGPAILARVNAALQAQLGLAEPPLSGGLDELAVRAPAADKARVLAAAIPLLDAQPQVAGAFTQDDLLATPSSRGVPPNELTLRQRFARSAYRGRNGDILVAMKPAVTLGVPTPGNTLAGHNSPWDYDRRVPMLFWWKDAPSQTRILPVETVDIAPTLAALLGVTPPTDLDGRCLPLAEAGPGAC